MAAAVGWVEFFTRPNIARFRRSVGSRVRTLDPTYKRRAGREDMTRMPTWMSRALGALAMLFTVAAGDARAAWPDRTITIIVIFAPGGSNDLLGRLIAAEL